MQSDVLRFQGYNSAVDFSFWHELTKRKLDTWHLREDSVPVVASFACGARGGAGISGGVGLPLHLRVAGDAFEHTTLGAGQGQVRTPFFLIFLVPPPPQIVGPLSFESVAPCGTPTPSKDSRHLIASRWWMEFVRTC